MITIQSMGKAFNLFKHKGLQENMEWKSGSRRGRGWGAWVVQTGHIAEILGRNDPLSIGPGLHMLFLHLQACAGGR
jgi:hypothetical protein